MDAARRWQVASAVTALAGIGLGVATLARPLPDAAVAPIELTVVAGPGGSPDPADGGAGDPAGVGGDPDAGGDPGPFDLVPDAPVLDGGAGGEPADPLVVPAPGARDLSGQDEPPETTIVPPAVVEDPPVDSPGSVDSVHSDDSDD